MRRSSATRCSSHSSPRSAPSGRIQRARVGVGDRTLPEVLVTMSHKWEELTSPQLAAGWPPTRLRGADTRRRDRTTRSAPTRGHRHHHRDRVGRRLGGRLAVVLPPSRSAPASFTARAGGHSRLRRRGDGRAADGSREACVDSGFRRLLFVNGHVGNAAALWIACDDFGASFPTCGSASCSGGT